MTKMPSRDDYFDHHWQPGLITQMIFAQREKRLEKNPDIESLAATFMRTGCSEVAATVRFLGTPKGGGLEVFGSGSIMPEGRTRDTPFSLEAAIALRELYVGSKRYGITPLEWLGYFGQIVEQVPPEARVVVNAICQAHCRP